MIPKLSDLLHQLCTGEIPLNSIFHVCDCDKLLELRDSSPTFVNTYAGHFSQIASFRTAVQPDPTKQVRYQAYIFVALETNNHEIASYVSDDFELIAWASCDQPMRELNPQFISFAAWLFSEYKSGRFPIPSSSND
jgi:hypothetical protein